MLAVKTQDAIVHEKIKSNAEGLYELLPSSTLGVQPRFSSVPQLVQHYAELQEGLRYSLVLDNPLYDNSKIAGKAVDGNQYLDVCDDAPVLPLKEREKDALDNLAASGDDMYLNATQAKSYMTTMSSF